MSRTETDQRERYNFSRSLPHTAEEARGVKDHHLHSERTPHAGKVELRREAKKLATREEDGRGGVGSWISRLFLLPAP